MDAGVQRCGTDSNAGGDCYIYAYRRPYGSGDSYCNTHSYRDADSNSDRYPWLSRQRFNEVTRWCRR
jgi:hypothetical protein